MDSLGLLQPHKPLQTSFTAPSKLATETTQMAEAHPTRTPGFLHNPQPAVPPPSATSSNGCTANSLPADAAGSNEKDPKGRVWTQQKFPARTDTLVQRLRVCLNSLRLAACALLSIHHATLTGFFPSQARCSPAPAAHQLTARQRFKPQMFVHTAPPEL
jgi:hypothetical protein